MGPEGIRISYDGSRAALYSPGSANDFFPRGPSWTDAALCAEMARLAYVRDQIRLEAFLGRVDFRLVHTFDRVGAQGFVARGAGATVIAFRGTEGREPSDLFDDVRFAKRRWAVGGVTLGSVHAGFADAFERVWAHLAPVIGGSDRLLLTGHSLGAALATLAASQLPPARLYTFGSPRVGDGDFARSLARERHDRYVNCCDLVSRVPPTFAGYGHAGTLRYIDRTGAIATPSSEDDPSIEEDRRVASREYVERFGLLKGTVAVRELADHAPVNYVSAVLGMRA